MVDRATDDLARVTAGQMKVDAGAGLDLIIRPLVEAKTAAGTIYFRLVLVQYWQITSKMLAPILSIVLEVICFRVLQKSRAAKRKGSSILRRLEQTAIWI